ncbi:hypothetical protein [Psychrobacillus sp. L3]|uniref:hypothetical protein n=1 Tax=Psychrobacillus sp. L3 TaxID=3236891 RepID=UPI0036F3283A
MKKKRFKKSVVATAIATSLLINSNVSFANSSIQETIDRAKMDMKNAAYAYVKPAENGRLVSSLELYQVLNLAKVNYQSARSLLIKSDLSNKVEVLKELDTLYNERLTKGLIPYIDAFNYVDKYLNPIMVEIKQAESEQDWAALEQAYHKLSVQLNTRTDILYRFTGKVSRDLLLEQYKKPANLKRDQLIVPVTIYMKVKEAETLMALGKTEDASKTLETIIPLIEKLPSANTFPMIGELLKEFEIVGKAAGLVIFPPAPHPSPITGSSKSDKNNTDPEERASVNKAAARAVTVLINALPLSANVNVSDGVAIEAARAAFEKLTTVQKAMVDITRLTDAEKAFEVVKVKAVNVQAANVVKYLIESLPAAVDVTDEDEAQVKEARDAYDGLTVVQKTLVGDITALEKAEQALVIVKEKEANKQAIELVKALIAALPVNVKVDDEAQIEAARKAYEKLGEDQQAMVDATALEKAEQALLIAKEKEANKKAIELVKALIAALPVNVKIYDEAQIEAARKAYEKLGEDQQAMVDATALTNAEKALEEAKVKAAAEDKKKAQEVIKLIDGIKKGSTAIKYKETLEAAETAYKNLTKTQKALVTNFEKLEIELADFAEVKVEASKITAKAIGVLVKDDNLLKRAAALLENGYTVTISSSQSGMLKGNLIIQPKAGDEAISGPVNFQVKSANGTKIEYTVVLTVEPIDSNKLAIDAVKSLIATLPAASDVKLSHKTKIEAARAAYKGLSDDQQEMVDITALTDAEKALEVLETAVADKAKAQEVIKLIDAIKKNNSQYKETLEAAKTAYKSLTEAQQGLVTNYEKLKSELADFAAIEVEASKLTAEAIGVLVDGDNLVDRVTALLEDGYTVTILTSTKGMLKGGLITQPKAGQQAIIGQVNFQVKSANGTKIERTVELSVEPKKD